MILLVTAAPDNEGRKFIFAFGSNYQNTGGALKVVVTTRVNNDVKFSYTYGNVTKVIMHY